MALLQMMLKSWSDGLKEKHENGDHGVHVPLKDAWDVSSIASSERLGSGEAVPAGSVLKDNQSVHTAKTGRTVKEKGKEMSMQELLRRLNKVQRLSTKLGNHEIPTEILKKLTTKY